VTSLDAFADLDQHPAVRALSMPRDIGIPFSAMAVARAAADIACDSVAYLSSFENHPAAVRSLAAGRALLGNPPAVLRRVRDPRVLAATLLRRGVAAAALPDCLPEQATGDPVASLGTAEWLLKPRASGGGHRVRFLHPAQSVPHGCYAQRYIDGTPGSVVCAAASGRAIPLGLSRQLVGEHAFGASGFRYCGNILAPAGDAGFDDDGSLERAARSLANVVAEEFALVGVNGIDFVARGGVPWAVEVNPRYSASMELVERAYGISVFGVHAAACTTGSLPSLDLSKARRSSPALGKAIVFARHDVVCGDTVPWLDDATVRDVPRPGERIPRGRPVCTVFAEGRDSTECHAALVRRAERVYDVLESWSRVSV
jgi:hypothetical protein